MTTHRPSGSMCASCVFFGDEFKAHCASLAFSSMKILRIKPDSDGVIVVKCTSFKRALHGVEL